MDFGDGVDQPPPRSPFASFMVPGLALLVLAIWLIFAPRAAEQPAAPQSDALAPAPSALPSADPSAAPLDVDVGVSDAPSVDQRSDEPAIHSAPAGKPSPIVEAEPEPQGATRSTVTTPPGCHWSAGLDDRTISELWCPGPDGRMQRTGQVANFGNQ